MILIISEATMIIFTDCRTCSFSSSNLVWLVNPERINYFGRDIKTPPESQPRIKILILRGVVKLLFWLGAERTSFRLGTFLPEVDSKESVELIFRKELNLITYISRRFISLEFWNYSACNQDFRHNCLWWFWQLIWLRFCLGSIFLGL